MQNAPRCGAAGGARLSLVKNSEPKKLNEAGKDIWKAGFAGGFSWPAQGVWGVISAPYGLSWSATVAGKKEGGSGGKKARGEWQGESARPTLLSWGDRSTQSIRQILGVTKRVNGEERGEGAKRTQKTSMQGARPYVPKKKLLRGGAKAISLINRLRGPARLKTE